MVVGITMGIYSSFDYEEIKVTDAKGLTEFCLKAKEEDNGYNYMFEPFLNGIIDGEQYSFQHWDDIKLISYWYDEQVEFLIELGKYIEGFASFTYETGDEKATLKFKDGKTTIDIGRIEYQEYKAEYFLSNK